MTVVNDILPRGALTRGVGVSSPVLCLGDLPKLLPLDLPTNEARAFKLSVLYSVDMNRCSEKNNT